MTQSQREAIRLAATKIGCHIDDVFAGLIGIAAVLEQLALTGEPLNRAALGVFRGVLDEFITAQGGLVDGAGVAVAPGILADVETWLQWYRASEGGGIQFTPHSFNPASVSYYDYTAMNWFQIPVSTRQASLTGPYIDIGGTDLKIVTASIPVVVHGTDTVEGVVAADLSLDFLELLFLRTIGRQSDQILLVTHSGKVIASNTSRHTAGTLLTERFRNGPEVSVSVVVKTTCQLANPWRILVLS